MDFTAGLLYTDRSGFGRLILDVVGHYGRPDIFQLYVNTAPQKHIHWQDSGL